MPRTPRTLAEMKTAGYDRPRCGPAEADGVALVHVGQPA